MTYECDTCFLNGVENEAVVVVLVDSTTSLNPNPYEAIPLCEVHEHDWDTANGYGRFTVEQAEAFNDARSPDPSRSGEPAFVSMGLVEAPTIKPRSSLGAAAAERLKREKR